MAFLSRINAFLNYRLVCFLYYLNTLLIIYVIFLKNVSHPRIVIIPINNLPTLVFRLADMIIVS